MDANNELLEIVIRCFKGKIGFRNRVMDFGQPIVNEVMEEFKKTFNDENSEAIHKRGLNSIFDSLNDVIVDSIYDFFEIIVFENDEYNEVIFKYTNSSNNVIKLTSKSICMSILKNDYTLINLFFK